MLAKAPVVVLPGLSPERHVAHPLHMQERDWPETNCYVDVWIEILQAIGAEPLSALGFTAAQDFEGDHFTFAKFPLEDLREQFGLEVGELALYDTLETHIVEQSRRGRMVLVEVDGYHLPDTLGVSYRLDHTKTSIAVNRIDPAARELDYFHNRGVHGLAGEDYEALMRLGGGGSLFPYAEFIKLDRRRDAAPEVARDILRRHVARRPTSNPVAAWRERVREQLEAVAGRDNACLHRYAFNTARQLGMNFELLGCHLDWMERAGLGGSPLASEACRALSAGAKATQFQLARAAARRRFDLIEKSLDPLVSSYERIFEGLAEV